MLQNSPAPFLTCKFAGPPGPGQSIQVARLYFSRLLPLVEFVFSQLRQWVGFLSLDTVWGGFLHGRRREPQISSFNLMPRLQASAGLRTLVDYLKGFLIEDFNSTGTARLN